MRIHLPLNVRRPDFHPIYGPTIHRPTRLIPTVFLKKKPIPSKLLAAEQIKLPPTTSDRPTHQPKTKTSIKIVQGILNSAELHSSSSSQQQLPSRSLWPQNLRVQDDWNGRGKWGEFRPDHLEWLGVKDKHKQLMLSLRAER